MRPAWRVRTPGTRLPSGTRARLWPCMPVAGLIQRGGTRQSPHSIPLASCRPGLAIVTAPCVDQKVRLRTETRLQKTFRVAGRISRLGSHRGGGRALTGASGVSVVGRPTCQGVVGIGGGRGIAALGREGSSSTARAAAVPFSKTQRVLPCATWGRGMALQGLLSMAPSEHRLASTRWACWGRRSGR